MSQPTFLTGVNADVIIDGNNELVGASFIYDARTDFMPANRLGTRYKMYGICQTGAILTVRAPTELNADPSQFLSLGTTGTCALYLESGTIANCDQVGIEAIREITDADSVSQWEVVMRCMGDFTGFDNQDADGRSAGVNE